MTDETVYPVVIDPVAPRTFRTFIVATTEHILQQVKQSIAVLEPAAREQALHILSFALALDEAWPPVRDLLLTLAPKLEQMGLRSDWLPYLERGAAESNKHQDRLAKAELSLHIGHLYRLLSQFDHARQWLLRSVEEFCAIDQPLGQARALNQLAYLTWQQHSYAEAEQLATTALELLPNTDPERASSYNTLGEVARMQQQLAMAEQFHRQALAIWSAAGDKRRTAWSLQNLGHVLRGQARYAEAMSHCTQAMCLLEETQDVFQWAVTCMNVAILYDIAGQPATALEYYRQAEPVFQKMASTLNLAKLSVDKGLAFLALKQWSDAEKAFTAGADLFQSINDIAEYLNALDGLGLTYLYQEQYDRALAIFDRALQELPQIQSNPAYSTLHEELSTHWQQAKQGQAAVLH